MKYTKDQIMAVAAACGFQESKKEPEMAMITSAVYGMYVESYENEETLAEFKRDIVEQGREFYELLKGVYEDGSN